MKTEFIDVSPTQKQIVFEIPVDIVDSAIARVTRDYGKAARLPGFRPGKAPTPLIKQRFREQILNDVAQDLIPRSVDDALRERALDPVDTPQVRDVSLEEGQPLTFTAAFETVPPLTPIDYDALKVQRSPIAIADEAVEAMLERLRERNARFEPVDGRLSDVGDVLTVDLTRRLLERPATETLPAVTEPQAPEVHEASPIEIGASGNPPGFDAEVTGLAVGGQKTFELTFPADYDVEDLQGARVEFSVTVKSLRRKVLPALDDEFAKDLGDFDSLDALRARIRHDMQHEAEHREEHAMRDELLRQVAAQVTVDIPEALVTREVDRRLQDFVGRLIDQGVDPMKVGLDWERFRGEQRDAALDTVKSVLALDEVARQEGLTVDEADLEQELARLAERTGRSVETVRATLAKDGGLVRLAGGIRREKTVAFLLSRATISTV